MSERVMRPTVPPPWLSWYRRVRPVDLPRGHDTSMTVPRNLESNRFAVYTSLWGDKYLPYLRIEEMLQRPLPSPSPDWRQRLNVAQDVWHAKSPPDYSKIVKEFQDSMDYHALNTYNAIAPGGSAVGGGRRSHGGGGGGASTAGAVWGGWAAGAALLALLVLAVRAVEKCLDRKYFNYSQRYFEELQNPNATAATQQHQDIDVSIPNLNDSELPSTGHHNADLPPPYSECAPNNDNHKEVSTTSEEPPPPYSACVVTFSNKDIPTVHIRHPAIEEAHIRQPVIEESSTRQLANEEPHIIRCSNQGPSFRQVANEESYMRQSAIEEPQTSSEIENVYNNILETRQRSSIEQSNLDEGPIRVELVFDNGRVVERTLDVDSLDDVPELVANVGRTVIGDKSDSVAYVGDSVIVSDSQDRVIFI